MPEQKMTYQERLEVEKKSESILVNAFTEYLIFDTEPEIIEAAKQNIASQAEAIRNTLQPLVSDSYIDRYLLDYGYIEPKTEENGI